MKTIDAAAYIKDKMSAEIARYPAGSVSKRDVIYNVPASDEGTYAKLDAALTKLVYDQAAVANLHKPGLFGPERDRLTALAQEVAQGLSASDAPSGDLE
jgi:hypothetical protein